MSRTTPSRYPKRMVEDPSFAEAVLDEGLVCHVAYQLDGQPFLLPTSYCRVGQTLYLHGSVGSHFFREMAKGIPVCVSVTLIDALVLARSVFHHSVNYRSVIAFGRTRLVESEEERWLAAERFTEHILPGRWDDARRPTASEMKKTMFIAIEMEEMSAKKRDHGVMDDEADMSLPVWAGILPVGIVPQTPIPDEQCSPEVALPDYLRDYKRG